jgi:hypothetical protein
LIRSPLVPGVRRIETPSPPVPKTTRGVGLGDAVGGSGEIAGEGELAASGEATGGASVGVGEAGAREQPVAMMSSAESRASRTARSPASSLQAV